MLWMLIEHPRHAKTDRFEKFCLSKLAHDKRVSLFHHKTICQAFS